MPVNDDSCINSYIENDEYIYTVPKVELIRKNKNKIAPFLFFISLNNFISQISAYIHCLILEYQIKEEKQGI